MYARFRLYTHEQVEQGTQNFEENNSGTLAENTEKEEKYTNEKLDENGQSTLKNTNPNPNHSINSNDNESLNDVKVTFLRGIFCKVFALLFKNDSYLLDLAGGHVKLANITSGMTIKIVSFGEIFPTLFSKIMENFDKVLLWHTEHTEESTLESKIVKFEEWKKGTIRGFRNFKMNAPYKNSSTHLSSIALKQ